MRVIVCIKEIPDPDAQVTTDEAGKVRLEGVPLVPNPFDENALEAAVQLKERLGGTVIALSVGPKEAERTVLRAMGVGADEGVLVVPDTGGDLDSYATASVLAAVVRRLGLPDLIVCGREAGDTSAGIVGPVLAEQLGISCITLVAGIEPVREDAIEVTRLSEEGFDVLEAPLPLLATVCGTTYQPRYPSMLQIMAARRIGVQKWSLAELALPQDTLQGARSLVDVRRKWVPPPPGGCVFLEGATESEKARALSEVLEQLVGEAS